MYQTLQLSKKRESGRMSQYNFSDIRRELMLQDLLIAYLQSEQKKRREELDKIERDLTKMRKLTKILTDPDFIKLLKKTEK